MPGEQSMACLPNKEAAYTSFLQGFLGAGVGSEKEVLLQSSLSGDVTLRNV